ncbi:probable MNN4-regulates the mannosylphosphorylation [Phialocephala subalpina]|uniref:Probable MNN4-regulates the mannosylphosphorylation n=1 Tax=Phialocephala subalpina TaxID=576137 RepID=A0A1L7WZH7_9HELO|nr:probable MNN4-regulates the mannosylphosphorylation [Phialocephala subalpina]
MLRTTATRSLLKSFTKAPTARPSYSAASVKFRNAPTISQLSNRRPQASELIARPATVSLFYATKSGPPFDEIDKKKEAKYAKEKIEPHPEEVSLRSSTRYVFEEGQGDKSKGELHGGMKADLETIKDTFSLSEVPRDALYIGAAGVIPYAATSLSTVYLAFDINHSHSHGVGYLFSPETAHQLLALITPVQIGYGAVIISFLGAIHWGMEFAEYGGRHSYRRYGVGVIATAVAWPTIFMPVEYALITQFVAFNFLYFADARASVRGWFPAWYSIYRFVLTFIVGASIVASLVGRGRIVKHDAAMRSPVDYVKADRDSQWKALEREEKERRQAMAEADEEGGEEESDDSEEGKEDDSDSKDDGKDKKGDKKDSKADKKDDKEKK